jgi:OOP family OmpA-OmpF porin
MITRIFLFAAASLAAASALAQDVKTAPVKPGFYVYGAWGLSMASYDEALAQSQANAAVGPGAVVTTNDERYTGKAYLGYRFNKYFGIEGGFADVAQIANTATGPGGTVTSKSKLRGANIAAVLWLPVTQQLSLYGKVGGAAIQSTFTPSVGAEVKSTDIQTFFGGGLQYEFSDRFFGRADYERYSQYGNYATGNISADIYSLGLGFKF